MAGLFDFKSAEDILQERMAKTEENRLQMLRDVSQGADRPEVVRLGANLGYILGKSLFGGKSEGEQLKETREMGETVQAMEQAGVGGEGSAQFDGKGSSYGPGVIQQARAEEQRRLGLLSQDVQQAERVRIGMERTPEDLDLVGRYRYMAEVLQDAGFSARAGQAALLADKEAQRQREAQGKLAYEKEQDAYEKEQAKAKEAQRQRELQDKINYERGQDAYENEQAEAKDLANLYKDFTSESIAAHRADPTKPLVPIKEGGFAPESRLGKLAYDLERLKNLPPTASNQAAIASIEKDINSEQVQYDTQLRELSGNLVKDFAGKGKASEVSDWNKGIDLTTNLMSQYENNPSKVRSHLNKYYRPYDGGFLGSSGFNVKEEYQKNVLTTQDGRAYYYDPDNKKFIGWAQ